VNFIGTLSLVVFLRFWTTSLVFLKKTFSYKKNVYGKFIQGSSYLLLYYNVSVSMYFLYFCVVCVPIFIYLLQQISIVFLIFFLVYANWYAS